MSNNWQLSLKQAISDPTELCHELKLAPKTLAKLVSFTNFPLRVPREFVARMEKGNPNDPLLLQILPTRNELMKFPGYSQDPLNEKSFNPIPGLLHKYHGRALVILNSACAIHCRYCFRRHFPYKQNLLDKERGDQIFNYLKSNENITEIILSGGDPLMLKDALLTTFISPIEALTHIKRIRIHTRLPIVIPSRITAELIDLMNNSPFQWIMVVHSNHPNEIDRSIKSAFKSLRESKVTLLNQSVLLKGINDSAETLIQLSERLFDSGILPYYLHLLDPVEGAHHFAVGEAKARNLISTIMKRLPGYLVPKLVRETAGVLSKVPLSIRL